MIRCSAPNNEYTHVRVNYCTHFGMPEIQVILLRSDSRGIPSIDKDQQAHFKLNKYHHQKIVCDPIDEDQDPLKVTLWRDQ